MSLWGEFCPKCVYNDYFQLSLLQFILPKTRSMKRIGPHHYDILTIIFGSLLGDAYAEKHGNGTRISFYQEASHKAYLLWLHNLIASKGYCSNNKPKIQTRIGKYGKLRYIIRFKTYTFTSLNWIHEVFYSSHKKVLPFCIDQYLSPLALAIWIMDDGGRLSSGIKLSTNNFTLSEVNRLCLLLNNKYNLIATVNLADKDQYIIYIQKKSMNRLANIVGPYIHSSMKYKLINI
jgi:ubiquinol-cytochrome c reductase cytochrome b subunit